METKKSEGRTAYQSTSLLWYCGLELTVVLIKKKHNIHSYISSKRDRYSNK